MTVTTHDPRPTELTDWMAVADHVADAIAPRADAHDRDGTFVHECFDLIRDSGILTAPVPAELGGGGASHAETGAILRRLGQACASTAVTLSMHDHLVCTQVWRWRHGQPAEGILRRVADERLVLVSTGASDWLGANGTARRVDDGFVVSARKTPASGAPVGNVLVTSIRWDDAPDGPQVIHCSVPFSAPGVRVEQTWDATGLRGTGSDTVVLEDVHVPDAAVSLVRPADRWHPVWNAVLGTALPLIMSAYLGIADRAVAIALESARGSDAPHLPALVGTMGNHHAVAEDAVDAMIRAADDLRFDNVDRAAQIALTRKAIAAEAVIATVRSALEVVGGRGFAAGHELSRLLRDAHGGVYHPLPAARQVALTGRIALGLEPAG
ncbi:MAG TPA: acyl-CoA dehydrogenase family protein [Acidimicrobiales bacterium]|nr:acyl-CoA dehydrogenase family protein [Acidimicrobiales bacterium]